MNVYYGGFDELNGFHQVVRVVDTGGGLWLYSSSVSLYAPLCTLLCNLIIRAKILSLLRKNYWYCFYNSHTTNHNIGRAQWPIYYPKRFGFPTPLN